MDENTSMKNLNETKKAPQEYTVDHTGGHIAKSAPIKYIARGHGYIRADDTVRPPNNILSLFINGFQSLVGKRGITRINADDNGHQKKVENRSLECTNNEDQEKNQNVPRRQTR